MLGPGFMCGNIDFWTDGHRKESYGALVVDLLAERYDMENGQSLFMSRETKDKLMKEKLDDSPLVTGKPMLDHLEYCLNFERFTKAKTVVNVTEWMFESTDEGKVQKEDFGRLAADGGSNAVGAVQEYEVVGREQGGRTNNTDFTICHAHQQERSGGFAAGTAKFASLPNEPLGKVLGKNHSVQVRMNRNGGRMDCYGGVQDNKSRDPKLNMAPANEVRWHGKLCRTCNDFVCRTFKCHMYSLLYWIVHCLGTLDECIRGNMIMGDLSDSLEILLSPEGMDYALLNEAERAANDITNYSYTDRDKKILRHFEGAAVPAKRLCKFLQDGRNSWAYATYELRLALQDTASPTIAIYADISRMDRIKDLRKRGEKTVLVKKSGVDVCQDVAKNYTKVELMDPMVEEYCKLYTKDFSERIGFDGRYLPALLTNHVLLNPMFGLQSRIVCAGLLTEDQYAKAKMSK